MDRGNGLWWMWKMLVGKTDVGFYNGGIRQNSNEHTDIFFLFLIFNWPNFGSLYVRRGDVVCFVVWWVSSTTTMVVFPQKWNLSLITSLYLSIWNNLRGWSNHLEGYTRKQIQNVWFSTQKNDLSFPQKTMAWNKTERGQGTLTEEERQKGINNKMHSVVFESWLYFFF